jgi:hypothetical protein
MCRLALPLAVAWLLWLLTLPPRPSAWIVTLSGVPILVLASWLMRPAGDERWLDFVVRTIDAHLLAALLLFALGVQFEDAHGVTTDGVIYFTQLRSVLFDGDLDVAAEFAFLGQPPRPYHVVPIGPTPVWIPLYAIVAVLDAGGRAAGLWAAAVDPVGVGLTLPYIRAALVSSFAIGCIGLGIVHSGLRNEFGRAAAFVATLLLFAATPLVWYMVYEPSMTHAASFGFVAAFIAAAWRWTAVEMSARRSLGLGVLIGLAFVTRPQEVVFALFPATLLMTTPAPLAMRARAAARLAGWAFLGAAPFLALQVAHSSLLMSRERFTLVGADGYLDFLHSRWADTLWSSWHGFLSWSPVAYFAVAGTVFYLARRWRWATPALVILFVMAWVNGSTVDWGGGWSFGGRRFISCLVILAPGLAYLAALLIQRPLIPLALTVAAAIGWHQLLLAQYARGLLRPRDPVTFAQIVRQQATLLTSSPYFYPFAFPANVWFAWQTGLPIDRYDLLAPEPWHRSLIVRFDADGARFLMEGWGPRAADQWGELRWMDGPRAEIILPLALAGDGAVPIAIDARTRLIENHGPADVRVLVNGVEVGRISPDTVQASQITIHVARERWTTGFNRIAFEKASDAPPVAIYRLTVGSP